MAHLIHHGNCDSSNSEGKGVSSSPDSCGGRETAGRETIFHCGSTTGFAVSQERLPDPFLLGRILNHHLHDEIFSARLRIFEAMPNN